MSPLAPISPLWEERRRQRTEQMLPLLFVLALLPTASRAAVVDPEWASISTSIINIPPFTFDCLNGTLVTANVNFVQLWDPVTFANIHTMNLHVQLYILSASPGDNCTLLVMDLAKVLYKIDLVKRAVVKTQSMCGRMICKFSEGDIFAVKFSQNGRQVGFYQDYGDEYGSAYQQVFDTRTGAMLLNISSKEGGREFLGMSLSPDGSQIAFVARIANETTGDFIGKRLQIFNPSTSSSDPVGDFPLSMYDSEYVSEFLFAPTTSPGSARTITLSVNGPTFRDASYSYINTYDVDSGALVQSFGDSGVCSQPQNAMQFSPDGQKLAALVTSSTEDSHTLCMWDTDDMVVLFSVGVNIQQVPFNAFDPLTFSEDGNSVMIMTMDGLRIFDATSGKLKKSFVQSSIQNAVFSPDNKYIVAGCLTSAVCIYDAVTQSLIKTLVGHTEIVYSVSVSADGNLIASGSADDTVRIWSFSGALLRTITGHHGDVEVVAFAPAGNGTLLASGGLDNTIRLWDASRGSSVSTIDVKNMVLTLAWEPFGRTIVSGDSAHSVCLWDAAHGTLIRNMTSHRDSVISVAYSPSATVVASGSLDGSALVWDVYTGKPIHTMSNSTKCMQTVAYSPTGQLAVSSIDPEWRGWVSCDLKVVLFDMAGFEPVTEIDGVSARSLAFNSYATRVLSASNLYYYLAVWSLD